MHGTTTRTDELPSTSEGERRLMIAVLVHALRSVFRDAEKPGRGAVRRLRQDVRWLTSPAREEPFAFERICEAVGIDPQRVRRQVLGELEPVMHLLDAPSARRRGRVAAAPVVFDGPPRGWAQPDPTAA